MKKMKKVYTAPDAEVIDVEALQLLDVSGVNADDWNLNYGGLDDEGDIDPQ